MKKTYKGIVIKNVTYQTNDRIVNVLTNSNTIESFKAKGAMKINSPFNFATSIGSIGEYEVEEKGKAVLVDCTQEFSPSSISSSIESYATLCFVLESINYIDLSNKIYNLIESIVKQLNENKNQLLIATYYLYQLLKFEGIELQLDNCVLCGAKTNIVDVNYKEGGFTCKSCASFTKDEEYLKTIRYISKVEVDKLKNLIVDETILSHIFKDIMGYFKDNCSYSLRSIKFLEDSLVK